MTDSSDTILRAGCPAYTAEQLDKVMTSTRAWKEEEYIRVLHTKYRQWRAMSVELREKLSEPVEGLDRSDVTVRDKQGEYRFSAAFSPALLTLIGTGNTICKRGAPVCYWHLDFAKRSNHNKRSLDPVFVAIMDGFSHYFRGSRGEDFQGSGLLETKTGSDPRIIINERDGVRLLDGVLLYESGQMMNRPNLQIAGTEQDHEF